MFNGRDWSKIQVDMQPYALSSHWRKAAHSGSHTHTNTFICGFPYLIFWDNKYHSRQSKSSPFHHHNLKKLNPTHEVALLHNIVISSLAALVSFVLSRNAVNRGCILSSSWIYTASANDLSLLCPWCVQVWRCVPVRPLEANQKGTGRRIWSSQDK